jgi:hypothetical protein
MVYKMGFTGGYFYNFHFQKNQVDLPNQYKPCVPWKYTPNQATKLRPSARAVYRRCGLDGGLMFSFEVHVQMGISQTVGSPRHHGFQY